jgi:hypothetical protein
MSAFLRQILPWFESNSWRGNPHFGLLHILSNIVIAAATADKRSFKQLALMRG